MTTRRRNTAELERTDQLDVDRTPTPADVSPRVSAAPTHGPEPFAHWGEEVGRFLAATVSSVRRLGEVGPRQRSRANATADTSMGGRTTTQRAEVLVDDFSDWTKRAGSKAARQVMRLAARAREEGEDIWAEAHAMQHHGAESSTRPVEAQAAESDRAPAE